MRRQGRAVLAAAVAVAAMVGVAGTASATEEYFAAKLRGGNETPLTLGSAGSGIWGGVLDAAETSLQFQLHYSGLEGGAVAAAHIHLGREATTGGIVIHLCGTGGTAPCPPSPGVISGVLTAANVVAVATQGVAAGDFARVVQALRRGDAYVNVHTATFQAGEVRGQVQ
jgi:hypothetical protein